MRGKNIETTKQRQGARSGEWFLGGGGLAAAFAAALCCIGPLVTAGLGLGAFAAAGFFHQWRPVFLGLAAVFVAGAWIVDWRQRRRAARRNIEGACAAGCEEASRKPLVVLTAVALLLGFLPYILEGLIR